MKKILILGAGLVSKPMVEYLLERNFEIRVASPMKERADDMIGNNPNGSSIDWSMDDQETLKKMISEYDLTVSLLPYRFHSEVAGLCIRYKKPLVTTSYVQPAMKLLDEEAKKAGIILLNEIGLDPGVDHMSAMKVIDKIHANGGKVGEFYSLCGALPAPEAVDNPLGYKFSWSPKGVVLASRNSALYLKQGRRIYIEPSDLFKDTFIYNFPGIGELEVYPNRDSISYSEIYNIPEVSTMYRGTLRYKGWCETLDAMKGLNMLDDTPNDYSGMSFADFLAERAGTSTLNLRKNIALKLSIREDSAAMKGLDWLGFFRNEMMNCNETTPFEITSDRMIKLMALGDSERDVVAMQHIFLASYPGGKREIIKSSLLGFGSTHTNTAIARTVALPAAIAAKMIIEKKIDLTGVHRPVVPEIYNPVLNELATLGIEMKEEWGLPESELLF
jgi:saccharopine dehydrogenase-like NADP-dependent oxidoreductase